MNIYVANLGFQTTDEDLRDLFAAFGDVQSAKVILDKITGKSRGFGFVEMPNDGDANKAIADLSGKEVGGRAISVSIARPKEDRGGGGGGRSFNNNRNSRW